MGVFGIWWIARGIFFLKLYGETCKRREGFVGVSEGDWVPELAPRGKFGFVVRRAVQFRALRWATASEQDPNGRRQMPSISRAETLSLRTT